MKKNTKAGLLALSPLFFFAFLYLVTSLIVKDFYKVPITVAFLISSIYAILITKGSINKRIGIFSKGAASESIMLMLWIFILAGAFAETAKQMGAVDATVNLTLDILPPKLLLPGLFIASCFISLAIGTSVGTIAALTPVTVGIAQQSGLYLPMVVAIIVGGAYFGDNLSFISDTTIVATQTQECKMSDKFKVNSMIVVPAAIIVMLVYLVMGSKTTESPTTNDYELIKIIPYLAVIITAVLGVNVMVVLLLGIIISSVIGIVYGDFDIFGCFSAMSNGILSMGELVIMTLLAGGMLSMIKHNGGITFIINSLTRRISGKRYAQYCIALLVCLVNICTANNTVAIITTGPLAKNIADKYNIDRRKSASILDTVSCFTQGLLPYGAQMLIAAGLANVSPTCVIPFLYYNFAIGLAVVISIAFRYPKRFS